MAKAPTTLMDHDPTRTLPGAVASHQTQALAPSIPTRFNDDLPSSFSVTKSLVYQTNQCLLDSVQAVVGDEFLHRGNPESRLVSHPSLNLESQIRELETSLQQERETVKKLQALVPAEAESNEWDVIFDDDDFQRMANRAKAKAERDLPGC